jgi:flagellar FlgN protein
VNSEIETYLGLLERRLFLLRLLAQEFVDCRKVFVALDLDGMCRRISEQEELCRQIQSLHPAIDSLQRICARQQDHDRLSAGRAPDEIAWAERLRSVMRELGETQAEVRRLNQIHAAFLRRSGRTVNMMLNFLGTYALTYAPTAGPALPAPPLQEEG